MKFNRFKPLGWIAVFLVSLSGASFASADVELELKEPKKFFDAEISGQSDKQSHETIQQDLLLLFSEVSQDLVKDSQTLYVEVTDIDLAGRINYMVGSTRQDIRVLRNNERYRLDFNYTLKSENGEVLKQGELQIKDFLNNSASEQRKMKQSRYQSVSYMYKDLRKWMESEFSQ